MPGVKPNRLLLLVPTLLLAMFAAACEDAVSVDNPAVLGSEATTVRVLLTDAPSPAIGGAMVDIGAVELIPADGGDPVVLADEGTDGFVNLLDLQGTATMPIADAEIEPGSFAQLRLIVQAARIELADDYAFRDGSTEKDLKIPSGAQTGIKLVLHSADGGPLEIVPGETVLVLDFDVSESFVLLGNPDTPAGIHGAIFKPTIRVTGEDVAASLSGMVTTALTDVSVEGLTVRATPTDGGTVEGYQSQTGTALTDENGAYTIFFLVPGSYDVTVDLDPGLGSDPESQSVVLGYSENATGVDFEILDITGSIAGTVSTELAGAVISDLTVTATPDAAGAAPLTTTTDDGGAYLFESVIPGGYTVTVEVGDDEVTDPASQDVDVGNNEDVTGVDFAIVEDVSGTISGTVSTALTDVTVGGLTVTADPEDAGAESVTTTTDADGTYTLESLAPGNYTVTVEVDDGLTTDPVSLAIELSENENETGADFSVVSAS